MRYSPPLDGIRAVAILAVLIFHVAPSALTGGFTGVDVFFVLSGFLITSIILHDVRADRFSFREFYLRRVQRLLPNLIATVLGVLVLWTTLLPSSTARQAGEHGLWALFSASNIYIWRTLGSYWGNAAEHAPLTHTWSLGIEEQFYLLFPTGLWFLTRRPRPSLAWWLLAPTLLSFAASAYNTESHALVAFYLLPTRLWELLAGATLAAAPLALGRTPRHVLGWIGLALTLAGFVLIDDRTLFPGVAALAPTVGALLVIVGVTGDIHAQPTPFTRLFSHPVCVAIGKLSYSLYLWHWPLIILGRLEAEVYGFRPETGALIGGMAGVVLGTTAYFVIEQPLRHRGAGRSRRLAAIAGGFAAVVALSAFVATRPRVADPAHRFDTPVFSGLLFNSGRPATLNTDTAVHFYDVEFPPVPDPTREAWRTGGIIHPYGEGAPRVVVLGSSHALMYSRLIDDLCRELTIPVSFLGLDAHSVFFGEPENREFDEARRRALAEWRPDVVFVIDRWEARAPDAPALVARLEPFIAELSAHTRRIEWVAQVPVMPGENQVNLREYVTWRARGGRDLPALAPDAREPLRQRITTAVEQLAARTSSLHVLRADRPFYLADGTIRYADGRRFLYADNNHLSEAGANIVRDQFRIAIAGAAR